MVQPEGHYQLRVATAPTALLTKDTQDQPLGTVVSRPLEGVHLPLGGFIHMGDSQKHTIQSITKHNSTDLVLKTCGTL